MTFHFAKKPFAAAAAVLLFSGVQVMALAAPTTNTNQSAPVTVSNPIPSHGGHHHGYGGKGGHHLRCGLMKQLNLTAAQKEQMKAIHTRFREENKATMDALRAKHEELKTLGNDPANSAKREALHQELRDGHRVLAQKHREMMSGILTPQQMEQMKTAKEKCRAESKAEHQQGSGHHHSGTHALHNAQSTATEPSKH
jgi:protein CpxP